MMATPIPSPKAAVAVVHDDGALSMPVAPSSLTIQTNDQIIMNGNGTPIGLHVHASPNHTTVANGNDNGNGHLAITLPLSSLTTPPLSPPLSVSSQPGSASSRRRAWASSTAPTTAAAAAAATVSSRRATFAKGGLEAATSVAMRNITGSQLAINTSAAQQPPISSARRNSTISIADAITLVTPQYAWNGRCGRRWICNTTADGGFRYLVLAGATCVCFLSGLSYVTSLYLVPFQDEFHVGRSVAALSSTLNFFFFAVMCTFAGRLADYYGVKKVLSMGLMCVLIGLLGTSFANGLPMVCIFFGAFLGAGLATAYMSALTVQPEWFPKRSGLAYGVTLAGSGLGNFTFAWAAQGSMDAYGWRTSLIVLAAIFATLAVAVVILVQKKTLSIQENHRRITRAITQLQLSAMSVPDSPGVASATATVGSHHDGGALWRERATSSRTDGVASGRGISSQPHQQLQQYHRPSITIGSGAANDATDVVSSPAAVASIVAVITATDDVRASTSSNDLTDHSNGHHQAVSSPSVMIGEEKMATLSVPSPPSDFPSSTSLSSLLPLSSSASSINIASVTARSPSTATTSVAPSSPATVTASINQPADYGHGGIQVAVSPSHGNNPDSLTGAAGVVSPIGSIGSLEFISPIASARVHPDPKNKDYNGGDHIGNGVPSSHRVMVLAPPAIGNDMLQSPRSLLSETQKLSGRKGSAPVIEAPPPLPSLLDWKLLKSPSMIWFMASQAFVTFPYYAPYVHLVPYADDHHLSTSQSSSLLMIISIGSLTGRLLSGAACDRLGALRCYRFCCSLMILCCSLWIACTNMISLAFLAAGFGVAAGGVVASTTASCPPLVGKERASSALGLLYGIAWLPGSLGTGYLMGWCKDQTGSYAAATYTLAGMSLIAIVCSIMAERVAEKINTDNITDNTNAIIINTVDKDGSNVNNGNGNGDIQQQLYINIPQQQIVVDATA